MRFSDFLLVSDPADLDFIVGYADDQNIRIDVADFFADNISGTGNPGYIAFFTSNQTIGNSQLFQDGSNIVIGGVNAMGYRLAVYGGLYAANGASIQSTIPGSDTFRTIGEEGDSFIIPHDEDESIWTSRRIIHAPAVLTTESATLGQLNTAISNLEEDIDILLALKVDKTSVGVPNGVASLDAGGKVPLSQIPDSIIGQVQYMGTWNALTNTPTLNFLVPEEKGHYYVVSVAGVFGGIDFQVGDWIISNGTYWEKVDNTDAVTSVFGRIGAILALEADYQSFYPRLSQAYDNPTWINTLAFSKITGVPPFLLENQTITLSGDVTGSGKTSISTTISDNAVTDLKLRDSLGTSVIGRSALNAGNPADIQALTDGHVLQRSGGILLFGLISSDSIGSIDWSKIINTPSTLNGYGITDAYTKTEADNKFVPYTGANANVNLGSNNITANSFIKAGGTSAQFLKADGSVDTSQYVPTTRSINAGTGLTGGGNLSSDVNIAFDTTWGDTRYAYRTRQLTINGTTYDLSADRIWNVGTVTSVGLSMPSAFSVSNSPVIGAGVLTVVGAGTILEYVRGDGSLATFPSLTGYVPYTGATQDVNLGTYGLISDFVRFNTSSSNIPSAEGVMSWDNTDGTVRLSVKGNTYSVPIGQSVISRVRNNTGTNLLRTNYQVVKVAGAQGQRLAVTLAQANNDANSASTLGLVCENISNNQEGFIVNIGQIVNVNTTGNLQGETWNDGDVLYLSPTIAGAITNIKPVAPQHTVILGYVEYAHANNGKIYVKIDNGYELEELHDVSAEPFINNGLLYRDTTLNLWKSATISTILGYTPAPQGNYITSLTGEATASGPGAASVTLLNSAVTGKVLTGLNITGNAIVSTDSILTAFGKLQNQVNQLVGGLQYEGTWNASTNTPTITSSVGTDGTFYIVSVAGTTNINGINDWQVGDWIVFHDTAWQKVDNSDSVSSVFGRVGNIVANQADYSAFYPLIADIKNGVLTVQGTGVLSGSGTFSANQATNNTISLIHSAISRTDTTSTQTPSFGGSFNVVDSITSSAEGHVTEVNTKTVTIPSTVASASQTGLLSSADWITFNSKQPAGNYVTTDTTQTITGLKTIVRSGDVLNFKIGTDTLYGLKIAYNQNELVPSGEATWSFVNTFNRNGVGYETTPISFFRGVLVTGERLLSASINSNLLDYYGNNPSGRYPVYAYNTGVQQFSTGIIVGNTTGVVNPATGVIADLPAGVVANFNGRVIGGNAVNSNEFITLSQLNSSLGGYLPLTGGTLTGALNGTSATMSGSFFSNASSVASFRGNWAGANYWGIGPTATNHQLRLAMTDVSGAYLTAPGDMTLLVDGASTFSSSVTANSFIKSGGTSSQYLMADGSVTTGGGGISGTTNSIAKFTSSTTIGNSLLIDNGSKINLTTTNASVSSLNIDSTSLDHISMQGNRFHLIGGSNYHITNNAYFDSTFRYAQAGVANKITIQGDGSWTFDNAPSGTVGNAVSFVNMFSINNVGDATALLSSRAPIFYDSNNTAYYFDGASTSRLYASQHDYIGVGQAINTSYRIVSAGDIYLNGNANGWAEGTWKQRRGGGTFYDVIDAGNYNSYSPTLTGGGASGTWSINITGSAGSASSATTASYVDGTSGGAIRSWDIRTISPSSMSSYRLGFGFTSYNNNNTSPWADYLHLRSYSDGSGGSDNLITFSKSGIGMRIWQQTFGSTSAYSSFADVLLSTNFSSYALPLTGGTLNGPVYLSNAAYFLGSPSFGFRFNDSASTINALIVDNSGNTFAYASHRAPIFYDSNNTAFYLDPASTSNLNGLNIGGRTALNTLYYPFHSNRDFPSGTLVQTNINYSVSEGDPFILEITGNAYGSLIPFDIQVQGYIYANTIINAAGISNGTNISGVRAINFNGNLCFWWPYQSYWQGFNVKVYSAYATYPENRVTSISNIAQPTTSKQYDFAIYQSFHTGNTSLFSSYDITFNRASSNTDMRAPIFYDSNDTSYYVDGHNISSLNILHVGNGSGGNQRILFRAGNDSSAYSALRFEYGGTERNTIHLFGPNWQSGNLELSGGAINLSGYTGVTFGPWNASVMRVDNSGNALSTGSMRAPIFFDSNNTGYYVDPTATTSLRTVGSWRADSAAWDGEFNGKIQYHSSNWYIQAAGNLLFRNSAGSNVFNVDQSGTAIATGDFRSYIFYDYGNTAYYVNPDGTSNFQYSRSYYWWTTYTPLTSPRWDTSFYVLQSQHWYGHDSSQTMYLGESGNHISIRGYSTADGSFRAPIFYDSDNTGYYLDPASGSSLNGVVSTNYITASSCALAVTGVGGQITLSSSVSTFGSWFRATQHIVIENTTGGYNIYVLDANGVGVVKNAGAQSWSAHSDARIKTVHSTLENNLSKLDSINPIYYSFNNFADDKNRIGLIAQEVQEHFPELVATDPKTDNLTLDYTGLIPVLLGAIKELKTEIETLKTQL